MTKFKQGIIGSLIGLFIALSAGVSGAAVNVYAEAAYSETELVVYIYGAVTEEAIISAGVKLTYNPAELTNPVAKKNETVWFMGAGTADFPYLDPQVNQGSVVFLLGRLDSTAPLDGVLGDRVLLGTVNFTRVNPTLPVADPAALFDLVLQLGRGGDYANFVTVANGTNLDATEVTFAVVIPRERGDANDDGYITNLDLFEVKNLITANIYKPFADCNADGYVTNLDMFCIKNK